MGIENVENMISDLKNTLTYNNVRAFQIGWDLDEINSALERSIRELHLLQNNYNVNLEYYERALENLSLELNDVKLDDAINEIRALVNKRGGNNR